MTKDNIPLSVPCIDGREWEYVKECLDTGWVSSVGHFVDRFESALARYVGRKYAVACSSGTAALHTALMTSGIRENDEVIMPALTFAAPAFALRYIGAWPVFMDADPLYWQLDVQKTADFLTQECKTARGKLINRRTHRQVRAIMPVHLLGHPVDMTPLMALAKKYGLMVIEDVAESIGANYRGKKAGSHGKIACFSFNGNKIITCGGGGMLVTDDHRMAERARHLTTQAKADTIEYVHDEIGYNYRLTNVQAAIGLAQMENLDEYIEKKRAIARRYGPGFSGIEGITCPSQAPWAHSTWWLYTILVDKKRYGTDSRALMKVLALSGIQARPLWRPLHLQTVFKDCDSYGITEADRLYKEALSLPSSVELKPLQQLKIINIITSHGKKR